jgi:HNH endonuclease
MKRTSRIEREGPWSNISRPLLARSKRLLCQLCGRKYGAMTSDFAQLRQAIHHIIPRRWLEARGLPPHTEVNLMSLCDSCHGRCLMAETHLFAGDTHGFLIDMRRMGFPLERIFEVARFYGLREFENFRALTI